MLPIFGGTFSLNAPPLKTGEITSLENTNPFSCRAKSDMTGGTITQTTATDAVDNPREVKYPAVAVIAREIQCFSSRDTLAECTPDSADVLKVKVPPGALFSSP